MQVDPVLTPLAFNAETKKVKNRFYQTLTSVANLRHYDTGPKRDDAAHLHQFVMHAAQDFVEERMVGRCRPRLTPS